LVPTRKRRTYQLKYTERMTEPARESQTISHPKTIDETHDRWYEQNSAITG
jgi:hypothetical protein